MPPGLIVEHQSVADALFGLGHTIIGFEIDLLMFQAAPEALDKHIVHPASLAIDADLDVMVYEYICEILAGKLTTLVTVKDFRCAVGCRTSGEYLVLLFITPLSQVMESPVNSGRFNIK